MSIDLEPHSEMHGGSEGHHESPEKVDSRQRLGVWLFIGADVVTLGALLFTYLYLRGVNTDGHWMTMMGYKGSLHSYSDWENLYAAGTLKAPTLIHVPLISAGLQWLMAALTVVSAGVLWLGEKALRTSKNAKAFSSVALLSVAITIIGIVIGAILLKDLPQIFVAVNDSQTMSYTTYDSSMLAIIASTIGHLGILAFLGLGLSIRSARGVINGDKWYQVRLVRFFWVWVAISAVVSTLITTTITTVH